MKQEIEFLVVADNQDSLHKTIEYVNASSGSDFHLIDYTSDEVGLAKIQASIFDPSRVFDLGFRFHGFLVNEDMKPKEAILPANPIVLIDVIRFINSKYEFGKLKFIKSEQFEEDITHVYLERQDTGSLNDIFRLGYYYALEMQKMNSGEAPEIL